MCGRYSLEARPDEIAEAFALAESIALAARYNIAPTQDCPIVRADADAHAERSGRRLDMARWGLASSWSGSKPIINARSETIARKPSFRSAFRKRRCLVPASGFYEWQKVGSAKQPFHIRRRGGGLIAFAGIWNRGADPQGRAVDTFAILTTEPNHTVAPLHDRMPVILDPAGWDLWLAGGEDVEPQLAELLAPAPDELLEAYPVSKRVNGTAHDDARCIEPLAERTSTPSGESLWDADES